jgi:saccharopine dehydrogenase (NAD+, L-lysine forming)
LRAAAPVIALELLDSGAWQGTGVLGPEAFPAEPFLAKLAEYESPHGILELESDLIEPGGVETSAQP